jgi:hypothetical protein
MKFLDCSLKYIGQTRIFIVRRKEYIHATRNNNSNSRYSNHIIRTRHTYGTVMDVMDIVETGRKGKTEKP